MIARRPPTTGLRARGDRRTRVATANPCLLAAGRFATAIRVAACAVGITLLAPSAAAAEIHRCPQADGTIRYQDRPCAATPPAPARPAAAAMREPGEAPGARGSASSERAAVVTPSRSDAVRGARGERPRPADSRADGGVTGDAPVGVAPATRATRTPETRREYVERNEARCRDGDRRACAAVTCERSGRLDSPACQSAVGYERGPGWELRPTSDLFDPDRSVDEFALTCRATGRRLALARPRGGEAFAWPDRAAPVARAALPEAARAFCAVR